MADVAVCATAAEIPSRPPLQKGGWGDLGCAVHVQEPVSYLHDSQ
jgi:hypothetical protein